MAKYNKNIFKKPKSTEQLSKEVGSVPERSADGKSTIYIETIIPNHYAILQEKQRRDQQKQQESLAEKL